MQPDAQIFELGKFVYLSKEIADEDQSKENVINLTVDINTCINDALAAL